VIFLDANYFLRALVQPTTPESEAMARRAMALFRAVERGEAEVTSSEAVLAEVAFVLASPRHYHLSPDEIRDRLRPILALPHLKLPRGSKRRCLRALDLWATYPRLGFVDALTAAAVEQAGMTLATFDTDFDALPGIVRYQPASQDGEG
jgi:predicted nucleic acid-binding protein